MAALKHMTVEDLKVMGIPMVFINVVLEFCSVFPSVLFSKTVTVVEFRIFHACDNLIVGSKEGKLCWVDMELSSNKPHKVLK
ncbi:hypothetical protein KIW84_072056 [Lathyrus oleraceus]|uniref:Uncharacterized protein n=1 Tax=Pisum sativum TaxID=3888 RepID=A0A9D4VL69_PEA|nr:hypothetical protein KIW84_072056 [Pisum sativum]